MGDKSDQPAHTFQAQPKDPRKEAASEFAVGVFFLRLYNSVRS